MSLWGTKDSVYSDGTIAVSGTTVTGTGTTFNTSGLISEGDVITVGAGATYGEAVVSSVTSATALVLKTKGGVDPVGTVPAGATYTINQEPQSTILDSNWSSTQVYGVDTTEQSVANAASGDARKYAPPHAGWVGITTYNDQHGNLRVKHEVLVAMGADANSKGGITGDAEDTLFPNS